MKTFYSFLLSCFITIISFGQDSNELHLKSGFKVQVSAGGTFLSNIQSEYSAAMNPLMFVEGGIEVGQKFNAEVNVRGVFGNAETTNLNFVQAQFGVNNKSVLNRNLSLVLRMAGGFVIPNEDYMIQNEVSSLEVKYLRVGLGLEQKITKASVMTFNLGYDISNNALFNGLAFSMGFKFGVPSR